MGRAFAHTAGFDTVERALVRTVTFPDGSRSTHAVGADGTIVQERADGTAITTTLAPHAQLGWGPARVDTLEVGVPSGKAARVEYEQDVLLAEPLDPFSLVRMTERAHSGGRTFTRTTMRSRAG